MEGMGGITMRPFNLTEAMAGAPVVTRPFTCAKSMKVIRLVHLPEANSDSHVVYVNADGEVWSVGEDGYYDHNQGETSIDLVMEDIDPTPEEADLRGADRDEWKHEAAEQQRLK
jgi:hypothetical protein